MALSFLSNFSLPKLKLFRGEESVLGIDIGTSSLKIVELKKRGGKIHLLRYGWLALGGYGGKELGQSVKLPIEKLEEALTFLLKEEKFSATRGVFSIPLSSSLIFTIEVPRVAENRLETVVPLEARKHIPVAYTDVSMVWIPFPEREREVLGGAPGEATPVRVLVIAILKPVISLYQGLAGAAGLQNALFEVETFSMIRSLLGGERKPLALVDIGADTTKVAIIDNGMVVASHGIDLGSQDITDTLARERNISFSEAERLKREAVGAESAASQKIFNDLFNTIRRVVIDAKVGGAGVGKTVLVGGGALLPNVAEVAKNILGHEVLLGNPFKTIVPPSDVVAPVLSAVGPEFAVSVGLALRGLEEF